MERKNIFWLCVVFFVFFNSSYQRGFSQSSQSISELESICEKNEKEGNWLELSKCQTKIGFLYRDQQNYQKSIEWMRKAIISNEKVGNLNGIKNLYANIGLMYSELNNYDEAIECFQKSLKINEQQNKKSDILSDLINIAQAQQNKHNYQQSNSTLERAVGYAQEMNDKNSLKIIYGMFSENYDKLGKYDKAKEYFELSSSLRSQLQKEEIKKYEEITKKAEAEINLKDKEKQDLSEKLEKVKYEKEINLKLWQQEKELNELKQKEFENKERLQKAKQRTTNIIVALLAVIIVIISIFIAVVFKQLKQIKQVNHQLEESFKQIAAQKEEIEQQRDIANNQKKKITDSIAYAQRIQNAVLPPTYAFDKILPEYFILFKPRDMVSGDFYWVSSKDGVAIVAAADCTGHGVPGAFMSMLGIAFLNDIINKMTFNRHILTLSASEILNQLRELVINSLHQTGQPYETKDGMDIALCIIDFENKQMQFAGAHNPAYVIRKNELIILEGDRMPIGIYKNSTQSFTNHEFKLELNDQIYLFSDGYYDQIGGPHKTKMLSGNFKNFLLQISNRPISEQKILLEENFEKWKGDFEQIDDVLIFGFKFVPQRISTGIESEYLWENVNILIAEDVDINYFLLVEALRPTGAIIHRAHNGVEAVKFCKDNSVDLVLMDIRMPEMDGLEATQEIRKFNKTLPIIAQTAHADVTDLVKINEVGCNDYISKPVNLKTFLSVIKKHLNK